MPSIPALVWLNALTLTGPYRHRPVSFFSLAAQSFKLSIVVVHSEISSLSSEIVSLFDVCTQFSQIKLIRQLI